MAKIEALSPNKNAGSLVTYEVKIGGKQLQDTAHIQTIEVKRELFRIATAEIVITDGDASLEDFPVLKDNKSNFAPGKEVEIKLGYESSNKLVFKGIIVKTGVKFRNSVHPVLIISCADKAIKMTHARKNEYYLQTKDSALITTLIGNHGLSNDVDSTTETHKEIIQYYATDWDMMITRAEANGRIVWTHDNKVIVKEPKTSGKVLSVVFGTDIIMADLNVDATSQVKKVTAFSWDMTKNKISKSVSSSEPSVNSHGTDSNIKGPTISKNVFGDEIELHNTGPLVVGELKSWADGTFLRSRLSRMKGTLQFTGSEKALPNEIIEIKGMSDYFNGDGYISKVTHKVKHGSWITEVGLGLSKDLFAETKSKISAPMASGLLPGMEGLYIGIVKDIIDPDGEYRIKVDIPVIKESGDGVWARISNLYATNEAGTFWMPEIADEVILGFLQNDPRHPIILGKLYSSKHKSPYEPEQPNGIKAIVSNSKMKIEFNDTDKVLTIDTPAGNSVVISEKDTWIKVQDQNNNKLDMIPDGITLDSPGDITIKAAGNIKIEATGNIDAKATGNFTAEGAASTLKGKTSALVDGGATDIKGKSAVKVAAPQIMLG